MDYVSLKIPRGLKAQKTHKKKRETVFQSRAELRNCMLEQRAWLSSPEQGMEPVVRQPTSSYPPCLCWQSSLLRTVYVMDRALTCACGCGWEKQSFVLPILKTWLPSSFATICSECLHSLFLFWRASPANPSGRCSASTYWALSMCPTGKDNKEMDNHTPVPEVNYRSVLRRNFKIPESSFHPAWEYSRYTCSPDSGKTSQIMFQMERTQFGESDDLISGPRNTCRLTTPSLSSLLNSMGRIVKSPIGAAKGTSKNISPLLHPGTK